MIRAAIFDLGGVLIDWDPRHLFSKMMQDRERLEYFLKVVCPLEWNEVQDAGKPLADATRERVQQYPEWEPEITAYYQRWTEMIAGAIPGTADIVRMLAVSNIRLFALSNWSRETFGLIEGRFPILSSFEKIFLSADFGMAKPDPRFYQAALREIGLANSELIFVDDNPRNVHAASRLGIPSIQFSTAENLHCDLARQGLLPSPT